MQILFDSDEICHERSNDTMSRSLILSYAYDVNNIIMIIALTWSFDKIMCARYHQILHLLRHWLKDYSI